MSRVVLPDNHFVVNFNGMIRVLIFEVNRKQRSFDLASNIHNYRETIVALDWR